MEFQTTWIHSTTVDEIEVRKFGSFTTLPVRISRYSEIANTAAQKLGCSWDTNLGMRSSNLMSLAGTSGANLFALALAEALPDRLATSVRLAQLGQLCDAFCDQYGPQSRVEIYEMLTRCLDPCPIASSCSCSGACNKDSGGKQTQLRTLASEVFTEIVQVDREHGMLVIDLFRKAFAAEPMGFGCRKSSPLRTLWPILEFSIARRLSDGDRSFLRDIQNVVDECLILIDEYWNANGAGGCQTDFSRMGGLAVNTERECLRSKIIALETRYLSLRAELYWKYPAESMRLRRWIEAAGVVMASYNYWRASSSSTSSCSWSTTELTRLSSRASNISLSSTQTFSGSYSDKEGAAALTAPTSYISSLPPSPSVQILNQAPSALNAWTHAPAATVKCISSLVTSLHNATTILSDINADTTQRYNQGAAHTIFGTSQATNSAYYTFIQSMTDARTLSNPSLATDILLGGFNRLYAGQSRELNWMFNSYVPSETEYLSVIDDTTGSLYTILVQLLQAERCMCGYQPDLVPLAKLLARFVRVKEDYLSFTNRERKMAVSCGDERAFSYPIIQLANARPESRAEVSKFLFDRKEASKNSHCLCSRDWKGDSCGSTVNYNCLMLLLTDCGALRATREFLRDTENSIEKEVMQLEKLTGEVNPSIRCLISDLREGLGCQFIPCT
ncbi:uncharacterized protein BO80DRAFT_461848 [Aspergillus ibericus CBS 121593]|uniref:Terpenoid synthase n=1 Tax=Aspergillus ibericus CBS 121593 TaxID=1448316 RepID=A0A395HCC4_9EURO|nr:hypothetical protein BO80DRAFT_461848 [Aspergillus ibericus CBS 121593]RAL04805.1 hypothetical protein BO80DRAFT_461848 [Aspergillus ibericus CBS 121593]